MAKVTNPDGTPVSTLDRLNPWSKYNRDKKDAQRRVDATHPATSHLRGMGETAGFMKDMGFAAFMMFIAAKLMGPGIKMFGPTSLEFAIGAGKYAGDQLSGKASELNQAAKDNIPGVNAAEAALGAGVRGIGHGLEAGKHGLGKLGQAVKHNPAADAVVDGTQKAGQAAAQAHGPLIEADKALAAKISGGSDPAADGKPKGRAAYDAMKGRNLPEATTPATVIPSTAAPGATHKVPRLTGAAGILDGGGP